MEMNIAAQLAQVLTADSGVDPMYKHIEKSVLALDPLAPAGSALKWYSVFPPDMPIPDAITDLARSHVAGTELAARGLGFVILHRCGMGFYFLIVCTWRGSNEIWETVLYKDGEKMDGFELFPRDSEHKPTFCVWELMPLWHEKQAWVRFLMSDRDENAAQTWLHDVYEGTA